MKCGILITNGSCEHPCWQNDDNSCSYACPNLTHKPDGGIFEGFTHGECLVLGWNVKDLDFDCSVKRK